MWRRCLLMLAGVLLLCALPSVAAAHTELVRADPADGAVLAESPGLAQLWFSGDIAASRSTARLVNDRGVTVPGTQLVRGSGDPRAIAVELPSLADGSYGLLWEAVSARDGHTTSGTVTFSIGHSGTLLPTATSGGSGGLVQRWIWLLALAGVVGPLALVVFVLRAPSDPIALAARRRLLIASLVSAVVAIGIHHSGLRLFTLAALCVLVGLVLAGRVVSAAAPGAARRTHVARGSRQSCGGAAVGTALRACRRCGPRLRRTALAGGGACAARPLLARTARRNW